MEISKHNTEGLKKINIQVNSFTRNFITLIMFAANVMPIDLHSVQGLRTVEWFTSIHKLNLFTLR
jgi:hypothetical protein